MFIRGPKLFWIHKGSRIFFFIGMYKCNWHATKQLLKCVLTVDDVHVKEEGKYVKVIVEMHVCPFMLRNSY